jgi:hypothetical protein
METPGWGGVGSGGVVPIGEAEKLRANNWDMQFGQETADRLW